jgi:hypothetical protein
MSRDLDTHDRVILSRYIDDPSASAADRMAATFAAAGNADAEEALRKTDLERGGNALRTIARAAERGLGWSGSATDVAHLFRAIRSAGLWP